MMSEQLQERKLPTEKQREKIIENLNERMFFASRVHVGKYAKTHVLARHHWYEKTLADPEDKAARAIFLSEQNLAKGYPVGADPSVTHWMIWSIVLDATHYDMEERKEILYEDFLKQSIIEKMDEQPKKGKNKKENIKNRRAFHQRRAIYADFLHKLDLDNGDK